jgi:hypothetical protein
MQLGYIGLGNIADAGAAHVARASIAFALRPEVLERFAAFAIAPRSRERE